MSKQKAENYAFPCSLIRANEKTLLTAQDLERVMDAKDMQQSMHILAEFGYGDGRELTDPRGFEEVLAGEMNRVSELVSSLSVEAGEFALFRLPKDYHNLKVLLKAEELGIDPLPLMSAGGNFDPKQMLDMLRERNLIMLDLEIRQGLTDAAELYAKSGDPQEIDLVLDHACYAQMRRMAEAQYIYQGLLRAGGGSAELQNLCPTARGWQTMGIFSKSVPTGRQTAGAKLHRQL